VEKYGRARQATGDNTVHAYFMLYSKFYKHKLRICNTYCFSTVTMVARMHHSVTLYVHCLSCLYEESYHYIVLLGPTVKRAQVSCVYIHKETYCYVNAVNC